MRAPSPYLLAALAALALPVAAHAESDEKMLARLQQRLAAMVPGRPAHCLPQLVNQEQQTYPGLIVYRNGRTTYVNRFNGACRLRPDFDILVTIQYGQLCRGDLARIVDSASRIERTTCVFGDFETYTPPPKR